MNEKVTLKNAELYKENGQYYLKFIYAVENDAEISEITIPKAYLPIRQDSCILNYPTMIHGIIDPPTISLYDGIELSLRPVRHNVYFTKKVIEEKVHELTLDEIEKKLGYKVKIVNKK